MTDTDPTPERRWTLEGHLTWFYLDGKPQFAADILGALNEAETLRAWKYGPPCQCDPPGSGEEWCKNDCFVTEARERVRVLEAALRNMREASKRHGVQREHWDAIDTALAGAETEAGADGGERRGG